MVRTLRIGKALALILGMIGGLAMGIFSAHAADVPAYYRALLSGGVGGWVNTARTVTLEDLQGRPVLVDFWTYGCINCMQIVPDLDALEKKFGENVLIVGVHSAKFEGEGSTARILQAAQRFGLHHPVLNDSDFAVWKTFGVHAWPTLVLLGPDGREVSRYSGEGHGAELEEDIASVLRKTPVTKTYVPLLMADERKNFLSFPSSLAYAEDTPWGPLYFIADTGHDRIAGFDKDGNVKVTIGSGAVGLKDGDLKSAQFNHPHGMTVVGGVLYVADTNNHALRAVDLKGGKVTTLAGNGRRGYGSFVAAVFGFQDRVPELASPWDVEPMADGERLAVAMAGMHQIWSYNIKTKELDIIAGSGAESITDGRAETATLAQPSGLSRAAGGMFFVDAESSSLRVLKDGAVETLIGTGLFDFGFKDGAYPEAMLQHPQGLSATADKVYIADTYNNAIRVYDRTTKLLSTLPLTGEKLLEPGDILVEGDTALVADTNHHTLKKLDLKTGKISDFVLKE
jgi:thiol-disulfide isomerase/thioredoxin